MEAVDLLLSQNFGPEEGLKRAIEADEGFALAHGILAMISMFQAQAAAARESVERAHSLTGGISRRERQQIEAIRLFVNGQGPQSLALIREHLAEYPRDAILLRLAQRLYVLGCSGVGAGVPNYPQEFFALMKGVEPDYGDDWAFLGQYAWANHEVGLIEEGRQMAQHSLDLRPDNAVAAHSVAHVFYETGDHAAGGDFLSGWLEDFDKRATYRVHLSWHQALFELALGHYGRVIDWYESEIRPSVIANKATSLSDSASLMWRMQIYCGCPPPVSWEEVRDLASPATEKPGPAFRDAHAALALATAGDEAGLGRMIEGLREAAGKGDSFAREVTLPLVRGIGSFAQGNYGEAVQLIEPVFSQFTRIGGSHAQREVFEDTLLEAYLRAEQFDKAEDLLRARLGRRSSVRDTFWLGRAQASSGQPEAASESLREVVQGWQGADPDSPESTAVGQLTEIVG